MRSGGPIMIKKRTILVAAVIWLSLCTSLFAEEKDDRNWKDEAELSYVDTSGNTDILSLSAKNKLNLNFTDRLSGQWDISALYAKTDGDKTAERYATSGRLDYSITEQIYAAGIAGWMKDEFSGIERRFNIGPAFGYKFLLGPKHFLKAEAGLEYVDENYTNDDEASFVQGRIFGQYEFLLTEKSKFSQSLEYLHDFDDGSDYTVNSVSAIITSLSDTYSIKTSYEVHYDHEPVPDDLDKTDTILSVALVVNFN
jgi:putative salt-induced outer membrane protein